MVKAFDSKSKNGCQTADVSLSKKLYRNVTWSPFVPRGENTAFASGFTKKGVH